MHSSPTQRLPYPAALALVRDAYGAFPTLAFAPHLNACVETATALGLVWLDWVGDEPHVEALLCFLRSREGPALTLRQIAAVCTFRDATTAAAARSLARSFSEDDELAGEVVNIIVSRHDALRLRSAS